MTSLPSYDVSFYLRMPYPLKFRNFYLWTDLVEIWLRGQVVCADSGSKMIFYIRSHYQAHTEMPKLKFSSLIKMKLCISHYNKKCMMQYLSLVKCQCHRICLRRREHVIEFGCLPSQNGFNLKKYSYFYVQNRSCRPKIDQPCQFH